MRNVGDPGEVYSGGEAGEGRTRRGAMRHAAWPRRGVGSAPTSGAPRRRIRFSFVTFLVTLQTKVMVLQ